MVGFSEMMIALMFTIFGGTSGNEALDYVDADLYFKSKGIEMTVESMMLEAKKPDVGANSFAREASVRRLLAIRTLGDLKDKKALAVLNSFENSKEQFVADYAKRAVAKVEGKPMPDKAKSEQWKNNLPILPKDTGVVINVELSTLKGKAGLAQRFKAMKGIKDLDGMIKDLEKEMIDDFYPVIDRIGNIKIDSITVAVAENVNNDQGWVVGMLHGEFDKQAVMNFINQEMADEMDLKKVEKTTYLMPEDSLAFAFQDNNTLTFVAGPNEMAMPLTQVQKAIDSKKQTIAFSEKLQKLIQKTGKKGNLWVAGLITGDMLEIPHIKEFETFRLETELKKNAVAGRIVVDGKDAKVVKQTFAEIEKMYQNFKQNDLLEMQEHIPKQMKPMITAYESLVFKAQEKEGIVSFEFPKVDPIELVFGFYMSVAGGFEMNEDEIQPAPAPAKP